MAVVWKKIIEKRTSCSCKGNHVHGYHVHVKGLWNLTNNTKSPLPFTWRILYIIHQATANTMPSRPKTKVQHNATSMQRQCKVTVALSAHHGVMYMYQRLYDLHWQQLYIKQIRIRGTPRRLLFWLPGCYCGFVSLVSVINAAEDASITYIGTFQMHILLYCFHTYNVIQSEIRHRNIYVIITKAFRSLCKIIIYSDPGGPDSTTFRLKSLILTL